MVNLDEKNPLKWPLICQTGILTIVLFMVFLLIAWLLFPNPATPLDHFLSDFGRTQVPKDGSPVWDPKTVELYTGPSQPNHGAIWFNLGCIITGCVLFLYYVALLKYRNEGETEDNKKKIKILTYAIVCLGFLHSFSLIMTGVFYEDYGGADYAIEHDIWSIMFFALNLPIFAMSGFLELKLNFKKFIPIYTWAVLIFDFIVVITINNIAIVEWIAVFTGLGVIVMSVIGFYQYEFS